MKVTDCYCTLQPYIIICTCLSNNAVIHVHVHVHVRTYMYVCVYMYVYVWLMYACTCIYKDFGKLGGDTMLHGMCVYISICLL